MKVSFDFDGTLSKGTVQEYAKQLIDRGFDVWVCTSRYDEENKWRYPLNPSNDDMYKVVDALGIPRDKIIHTNMNLKSETLIDLDFIWHLDDDWIELKSINKETKTKGISVFGGVNWKGKCERIISTNKTF